MELTGFVLVGGHSTRMGRNKALLPVNGTPLVQILAASIRKIIGSVKLVGDPATYSGLGFEVIPDRRVGNGPLAGIESALHNSRTTWNFVIACDLPYMQIDVLLEMGQLLNLLEPEIDCVVPKMPDGRLQPLCALYRNSCLPQVTEALDAGRLRVTDLVNALHCFPWPTSAAELFQNMNTPEDWDRFLNAGHIQ